MRVNVYAEEMTDRIEVVEKEIDGHKYTAIRFYLELPVTYRFHGVEEINGVLPVDPQDDHGEGLNGGVHQLKGPFVHKPFDDDSSAVTFWGKQDLRKMLRQALQMLDEHYGAEAPKLPDHGQLVQSVMRSMDHSPNTTSTKAVALAIVHDLLSKYPGVQKK